MQVATIYKTLEFFGRKGVLTLPNELIAPTEFPVTPGSTFILVEEQPKEPPWFSDHGKLPSLSSLTNSVEAMKKYFGTEVPLYDICRTSAPATPLPLLVEAFGMYVSCCKAYDLDAMDWEFVQNMMAMSTFYDDESLRQSDIARFLEAYLLSALPQFRFKVSKSRQGFSEPDIRIEVLTVDGDYVLVAMFEVKPEMGLRGEPLIEAMKYFSDHVVRNYKQKHWSCLRSCCPVLIVEVVGATIRAGGAAFLDKPCYQPFTPYLHIFRFLQDQGHWEVLSRALGAIRMAIASLADFYRKLEMESRGSDVICRADSVIWPSTIRQEERNKNAKVIQYERQLTRSALQVMNVGRQKQLLFYLSYPDGQQRIIKFCQRYGDKVHALWAEKGFAPQFHLAQLQGSWLVIDMEFYCEEDGWRPLIALDPRLFVSGDDKANKYRLQNHEWEKCKLDVKRAYEDVHDLNPLFVHGDMRRQNILYNVKNSKVAFIDFDWAGTDGQDKFPLFLNPLNSWPPGVMRCAIMKSEHDAQLLDSELG
ncbi:hypothetical protein GOP47_0006035 [Adiantum capillus-veneris]|uniref:Aminoglycoside phosphotransferase domain-containing protein n=1 Tax=Adiantum capillus-veneris TaxID=13818 RepID=A0A9D4V2H3_ADICA|nr:hypothetical protein GOP47_0006035 [Adiantum capillus-veneris]